MKTLIALLALVAVVILCRPTLAQQPTATSRVCTTCVRVQVALALARAQALPVIVKPAPTPEPVAPEPEPMPEPAPAQAPVRFYRLGSLPANFSPPVPIYYQPQPQVFCPTGNCVIPGR